MEIDSEPEDEELEAMEGVEAFQQQQQQQNEEEAMEEDEALAFKIQQLCNHYQVPFMFQSELHTLLFEKSSSPLARRLDRARITQKPTMDILVASAISEMKNQLTFQVTKHFLIFRDAAGELRGTSFLRLLNLRPQGPILHYHSLASAWKRSSAKQLTTCDDSYDHPWKEKDGDKLLARVDESLRSCMLNLLWFDLKCGVRDRNWALKIADGLMELAEQAVFGADIGPQIGEQMRLEVSEYGTSLKFHRDRFAHVFECSSQLAYVTSEEFFLKNSSPPTKKMGEPGYFLFKTMIHHAETGLNQDSRFKRGYDPAQQLLYETCIHRVKELHYPLVEQFEDRKMMLQGD